MRRLILPLLAAAFIGSAGVVQAADYAWPENFEGVMLQGFYWDSYKGTDNTKWTTLTNMADELSANFKVIWVPNSAKAASNPGMGYDPVYWFTNHNTAFGTETQLRTMIKTFKDKGTDIIEDVVINHRSGTTNWTDFPSETWKGKTYKLGPEHICSNDEVAYASGQAKPTGAPDTGENFDGSRDLDHTNKTVQDNCSAYCKFLIEDLGYAGFRYDMVKGYSGKYNKIYNEASKPKYSVGEYWDGNYDAVAAWIEATGRQSAAFDFPCKYAINEAFSSGDMRKLVWKANGTTDQPAGMIHYGYPRYAVTFIDNHDTYRDGSKFTGNVLAANAFILCSPGTPCVFWKHYVENKEAISALIKIRNAVGVHNQSAVRVLRSEYNCYMAEVTGKKGKLVVKIGGAMVSPDGYSNSDIRASGNDYCVWSKTTVSGGDTPVVGGNYPENMYLIGNLKGMQWASARAVKQHEKTNDGVYKWTNIDFEGPADAPQTAWFSFLTALDPTDGVWTDANASDRYGATSKDQPVQHGVTTDVKVFKANEDAGSCYAWSTSAVKSDVTLDLKNMRLTVTGTQTGVEEITVVSSGEEDEAIYFNLQGSRVEKPAPGIYIRVAGGKSSKVIVR